MAKGIELKPEEKEEIRQYKREHKEDFKLNDAVRHFHGKYSREAIAKVLIAAGLYARGPRGINKKAICLVSPKQIDIWDKWLHE